MMALSGVRSSWLILARNWTCAGSPRQAGGLSPRSRGTVVHSGLPGHKPSNRQIATVPVLLSRQRMSVLPLPSKSPVPATTQLSGTTPRLAAWTTSNPYSSQMASVPVLPSRQKMSPLLSVPAMVQFTGTVPRPPACDTCKPFINQSASAPALPSRLMGAIEAVAPSLGVQLTTVGVRDLACGNAFSATLRDPAGHCAISWSGRVREDRPGWVGGAGRDP